METKAKSGLAPVGRILWFIGPVPLFVLATIIARDGGGWLTTKDILFFVVLGIMIAGRCLEFRGGDPRTAAGEPATRAHLRRYALLTLITGLGVWTAVNLIGNRS